MLNNNIIHATKIEGMYPTNIYSVTLVFLFFVAAAAAASAAAAATAPPPPTSSIGLINVPLRPIHTNVELLYRPTII